MIPPSAFPFVLASSLTLLSTVYAPLPPNPNLPPKPPGQWHEEIHPFHHPGQWVSPQAAQRYIPEIPLPPQSEPQITQETKSTPLPPQSQALYDAISQAAHYSPQMPIPINLSDILMPRSVPQTRIFTPQEQKLLIYMDQLFDEDQQRDQAKLNTFNHRLKAVEFGSGIMHNILGYNIEIVKIFESISDVRETIQWNAGEEQNIISRKINNEKEFFARYDEQSKFQTRLQTHYTDLRSGKILNQPIGEVFNLFYENKLRKLALGRFKNRYEMQHLGDVVQRAAFTWIYIHLYYAKYFDKILEMIHCINNRVPIEIDRIGSMQHQGRDYCQSEYMEMNHPTLVETVEKIFFIKQKPKPLSVNERSHDNLKKTIEILRHSRGDMFNPTLDDERSYSDQSERKRHYDNKWEYLERDKKKRAEEIRRQAIDVQKTLGQIGKHYGMEVSGAVAQGEIWNYDVINFAELAIAALHNVVAMRVELWIIIWGVLKDLEASEIRTYAVYTYQDMVNSSTVLAQQEVQLNTARLIIIENLLYRSRACT